MKTAVLSLFLVLFAVGCSKKENAHTPSSVSLAHGDLASPVEITTNKYQGHILYDVQINLSRAKQEELCKISREYPNRDVKFVVGSKVVTTMRMAAKPLKPPVGWTIACDSFEEASVIAEPLKVLSQ